MKWDCVRFLSETHSYIPYECIDLYKGPFVLNPALFLIDSFFKLDIDDSDNRMT